MLQQQVDYLNDNKLIVQKNEEGPYGHLGIKMDFIIRYENFDSNLKYVCKRLGIKDNIKHTLKTRHKNYREYYDNETKNIVYELFYKDFKAFNYRF